MKIERQLERIHHASYGWALACCRHDHDEARDVLQTAYLKAIDGRARFENRSSLKTWFFGVVRRTAAEKRRRGMIRRLAFEAWVQREPAPAPIPTPERLSGAEELRVELQQALNRLSPRQRALLHLVFYQELTIEDASAVLGISVGSARTHYARGKDRLRLLLNGAGETTWTSTTITNNG